jgi:SanA protein
MKKEKKSSSALFKLTLTMFLVCVFVLVALFSIYFIIYFSSLNKIYSNTKTVPKKPVAIIFGAGYYSNGKLSAILEDRVKTGIELYKKNKVEKLLMTGSNPVKEYDEPTAMMNYAIKNGVPKEDIVRDYAGFRTYDSVYRARNVFEVKSAILVTQRYHMFRAIYTSNRLGIVSVGVTSNKRRYLKEDWYQTREFMALILSFIEVNITKPKPKYLGEKIPIHKEQK